MQNNISKIKNCECTGCGACYNICPTGAIRMLENDEGFLFPVIDKAKCTGCGLCINVCPSINTKTNNVNIPKCYAVMANNEIRLKSSSGGMFTLLAEYILDKGGYVCGAAYKDDWSVHHIIIDNKKDLDKLRQSKYVQSDMEECYKKIKKLLNNDNYVLFCGCPCQVSALYTYLGKEYEKLYTADLLCHGTPSPLVWRRYLNENFDCKEIANINFRNKQLNGYTSMFLSIKFKDGKIYNKNKKEDLYEMGFHAGLFNRESCSPCKYAKLPRNSDITIADWWGIKKVHKSMDDGLGTSLVTINSTKGVKIFNAIKKDFLRYEQCTFDSVKNSINVTLWRPISAHPHRNNFFKNIKNLTINKNIQACMLNKYDVCLICNWYGMNWGSNFVQFAVYKLIEKLGYSIIMLDKPLDLWPGHPQNGTLSYNFGKKHYNITKKYLLKDLGILNDHAENFIVGSDQLFRPVLNMNFVFLEWVKIYKNKIAFATSFGTDKYNASYEGTLKNKYLLRRFNHLALRETPKELCKDIFDIDTQEVIDPSLMLEVEEYNKLANCSRLDIKQPYLLTYVLDANEEKTKIIQYVAKKLNLDIVYIPNLSPAQRKKTALVPLKDEYTHEDFMFLYKNADYIVTDSYHGTCFSIKYNKPFISIKNNGRGGCRYKMFDLFGLKDRILEGVFDKNKIDSILNTKIDYTDINNLMEQKTETALNWLKNAISNNNSTSKFSPFEIYSDLEIQKIKSVNLNNANKIASAPPPSDHSLISVLQNIFSVKNKCENGKKIKVITFMGIKIKHKIKQKEKK